MVLVVRRRMELTVACIMCHTRKSSLPAAPWHLCLQSSCVGGAAVAVMRSGGYWLPPQFPSRLPLLPLIALRFLVITVIVYPLECVIRTLKRKYAPQHNKIIMLLPPPCWHSYSRPKTMSSTGARCSFGAARWQHTEGKEDLLSNTKRKRSQEEE